MSNVKYFIGNELFLYIADASGNTNPIAYATECSLSINANQIDTSNKQSGVWASALPGQLSWSASASAIYTSEANYSTLFDYFKQRKALTIKFGCVQGLDPTDASTYTKLDTTHLHYTGTAYITSMELQAGNGEVATFSCELTGEGALAEEGSGLPTSIKS